MGHYVLLVEETLWKEQQSFGEVKESTTNEDKLKGDKQKLIAYAKKLKTPDAEKTVSLYLTQSGHPELVKIRLDRDFRNRKNTPDQQKQELIKYAKNLGVSKSTVEKYWSDEVSVSAVKMRIDLLHKHQLSQKNNKKK